MKLLFKFQLTSDREKATYTICESGKGRIDTTLVGVSQTIEWKWENNRLLIRFHNSSWYDSAVQFDQAYHMYLTWLASGHGEPNFTVDQSR